MKFKTIPFVWASFCLLGAPFASIAADAPKTSPTVQAAQLMMQNQGMLFQQNLGQLADPSGHALPGIKYYGSQGDVSVYCQSNKISFVFTKVIKDNATAASNSLMAGSDQMPEILSIEASRMEMELIGANGNAQIVAEQLQGYTASYFLIHTGENGVSGISSYKKLTYKDIYPHIDLVLLMAGHGMEYSFIVHPGGKVSDIKLRWNGIDKAESLKNGGISYGNALGNLTESAPMSFVDGNSVVSNTISKGDSRGFQVENYDNSRELIIDPSLDWATYFGGSSDEYANDVKTDASGNVYIIGSTLSKTGIATTGAYQSSYSYNKKISINYDVFLAKFSSTGSKLWATYYGYSISNFNNGLCLDASGNVFITGNTIQTTGIASSGAYQTALAGSYDAFLAKFSSSGTRLWATYFGGSGADIAQKICSDASGYIFITGQTGSSSGVATGGAYQTACGGPLDAFLAKFSNSGSLIWASYYGGANNEAGNGICTDASGNVYMTGGTTSSNGIATSGSYQPSYGGSQDGFLAKFSSSGTLAWGTYFGGSAFEVTGRVISDVSGDIYIAGGYTQSSSGIATSGAYQTSYGGSGTTYGDAFLAKFSSGGSIIWATYFGGSGDDNESGLCTDGSGNVFISGQTFSTSAIASTGGYQTKNAGNGDAYLAQFSSSGSLIYATYYGGSTEDKGRAIDIDASGNLYLLGNTASKSGIATSGAYQTRNAGGAYDAFLAKFVFPTSPEPHAELGYGQDSSVGNIGSDNFNTSISDKGIIDGDHISIYPNPFTSVANIQVTFAKAQQVTVEIWSLQGKLVKTIFSGNVAASNPYNFKVDGSNMSPGMYSVRILNGDNSV